MGLATAGTSTSHDVAVLLRDPASAPELRSSRKLRVFSRIDHRVLARFSNLFVLCSATELPSVAEVASAANRQHRLRALFVRQDIEPEFIGPMLDRAQLRLWRNVLVHQGPPVPGRILRAWELGAQDHLIAEAAISAGRLFALTCALERLEIPVEQIRPLTGLPETELKAFRLAEDGSYLHWPNHDVHLDLDALRYIIDPAARAKADVQRTAHDERFGVAIAAVRQEHGLRQSDIAGLSDRQVRRIEAGSAPRVETLRRLAKAHGLELSDYLARVSEKARESGATT